MKKKIILISSISIVAIAAAGLILFLVLSKNIIREEIVLSGDKYIAAKSGLNLRSSPNKSSSVVTLIPFGSKVTIEKSEGDEILLDERYGKWVNVKYGNKTGWVFSGFLCDFKPNTIIKIAADSFKDECRKDEWCLESKEYTNFKDSDVTIKNIIDNYILLQIPHADYDGGGFNDAVWRYDLKQKKFFPEVYGDHIEFLYLDNDKYPDLAVADSGHGGSMIRIFLGSKNGLKKIYDSRDYCFDMDFAMTIIGSCGDMRFACNNREEDPDTNNVTMKYFRFNCNKRKVEKYAESIITRSEGIITSIDWVNMSIVIKDNKDFKDTSYKFPDIYRSSGKNFYYDEYFESLKKDLKKLQKGKDVSFSYVAIKGEKIIHYINLKRE